KRYKFVVVATERASSREIGPGVRLKCTFRGHIDYIRGLAWSNSGEYIASASEDGIRIWNMREQRCVREIFGDGFHALAWSPDDRQLAFASSQAVAICELAGATRELWDCEGLVHSLAWSPNGATLAAGTWDSALVLQWDLGSAALRRFSGHTGDIS